jgi:CheY-like chemotaxis protein
VGKKILLADDSITIQKVIELTFSDEDFEVVTVGNGRLAIERLPEARPDLVLCDIIMPEKDGYEVCEFIKKHPALSHIPVLLLTGAFEPFDQERANRVGCDGFLAKPFEPQTLIAKVKDLLAKAGSKPSAPPLPSAVAAPSAAPPWSTAIPTPPRPASTGGFSPAPAPITAPEPEPEPDQDDFTAGPVAGAPTTGSSGYVAGQDVGTVSAPAYRATDGDEYAKAPASLDELYDDDPYGATDDLMPLSDDEAESVAPPSAPPPPEPPAPSWRDAAVSPADDEPAPWAQPTVEVPLELRAQAGVESAQRAASDGFEEVFEDAAPERAVPPSAAVPAPTVPTPMAPTAPTTPAAPTAPPTVEHVFGFVGQEEDKAAAPAAPAATSPDSSFRDVAPAEEEDKTSITRSVAGEVHVPVDMVEKIAQRVVAQISEKVIREIAWEVIPDLAEALIKREIDRLKAELQNT